MARIWSTLVALTFALQTLAAPVNGSATASAECNTFLAQTIQQIAIARTNLASINSANDGIATARSLLEAQFSLLDANNATQQIAISLGANAPPAPADAGATIVSGLKVSLASLKDVVLVSTNDTKAASAAKTALASALSAAQSAAAGNCQNAGASSATAAEPSFGSEGSGVSPNNAATTAAVAIPSLGSGFATQSISPATMPTASPAGLKGRRLGRAPRI
ncbi:hypothetical protein C8R47DRAFT_640899 [Mycena vitilis]|nr:hypothetical protein C8R47DRAFT_640899 [Mycena vitilis]